MNVIQGTLQLVVDSALVDQIQPLLADLGISATINEI